MARFFAAEQATLDDWSAKLDAVNAELTELEEEHGGEDGAFGELEKINKATVAARLQEVEGDAESEEEAKVLRTWLQTKAEAEKWGKQLSAGEAALNVAAYEKCPELNEAEIKTLVVEDKWLATLDAAIHSEVDGVSQALTTRVKELAERYNTPLSVLSERVSELEAKVNGHLERMGFAWT